MTERLYRNPFRHTVGLFGLFESLSMYSYVRALRVLVPSFMRAQNVPCFSARATVCLGVTGCATFYSPPPHPAQNFQMIPLINSRTCKCFPVVLS